MPSERFPPSDTDGATRAFYARSLRELNDSRVPYLVGGAYALGHYTRIDRFTKDFDIFIRRADYERVMQVFAALGCTTELTHPHWLGKARSESAFVDVIFSSGNGVAAVDDEWFEHATDGEALGVPVRFCPAEEMIWSKSFVMERERYDGADVMHLLLACGPQLDWPRLLRRFGPYWRVLLSHLILFGFIYPSDRRRIPEEVLRDLLGRLQREMRRPPPSERVCWGTILSRAQYLIDIEYWGYGDARLTPPAVMTDEEVARWTAAIESGGERKQRPMEDDTRH